MGILYRVAVVLAIPTIVRFFMWVARYSVYRDLRRAYPEGDSPFVIKRRAAATAEHGSPSAEEEH